MLNIDLADQKMLSKAQRNDLHYPSKMSLIVGLIPRLNITQFLYVHVTEKCKSAFKPQRQKMRNRSTEGYSRRNKCCNRHRGRREQKKKKKDGLKRRGMGEGSAKSNTGEWVRGLLCGCKRASARDSEKVAEWKREKERERERCWCFLNSLRGTPNPLSSTNQLTDCHLPRSRWGWWGEQGL